MKKILRQNDLIQLSMHGILRTNFDENQYIKKHPILKPLSNKNQQHFQDQHVLLRKTYKNNFPTKIYQQGKRIDKHLKKLQKLTMKDLKNNLPLREQTMLLKTDNREQFLGGHINNQLVQQIEQYQHPFKHYESLIHKKWDYKYIHNLAQRYPHMLMMSNRFSKIYDGHHPDIPYKFYQRNTKITPKENKMFMKDERKAVKEYRRHLVAHVYGQTLQNHQLESLIDTKINPKKKYTLSSFKLNLAKSNRQNPKQIFTYTKELAKQDPSKALSVMVHGSKVVPALNYTVRTTMVNNHLLPKDTITNTLDANGMHHKSNIIDKNMPDWVHYHANTGIITTPTPHRVQQVAKESFKQYKIIHSYQRFKQRNAKAQSILQQAGINQPLTQHKVISKKLNKNHMHKKMPIKHDTHQFQEANKDINEAQYIKKHRGQEHL